MLWFWAGAAFGLFIGAWAGYLAALVHQDGKDIPPSFKVEKKP